MFATASIFQDGMILQRQKPVSIWGTQTPGMEVTAEVQGKRGSAVADDEGNWMLTLPPLEASEDERLVLRSGSEQLTFERVAVGEVWLAGGQSNMELWMRFEMHRDEELANCPHPKLRFFDVPEIAFGGQKEAFDYSKVGIWREASLESLDYFSAVGYYFQKELSQALDVPVGIIGCNWGGTTTIAWMNPETSARVGKSWFDSCERTIAKMDMDAYWQQQVQNPANDTGSPLENPATNFMLGRTHSEEEILEHYGNDYLQQMQERRMSLKPMDIPGSLYEHMLKTAAPYSIRGFLWYQGENDEATGHGSMHGDMLTGLIGDWRELWGNETLPFLIVQLPGLEHWAFNPNPYNYPVVRECQQRVADTVEGAYLCSAADAGEKYEIHPKNKKVVGQRLALLDRGHVYGEGILCDAPRAVSAERCGNEITIRFAHAEGGLRIEGDILRELRVFLDDAELSYTATIEGDCVRLAFSQLPKTPVQIRFAATSWICVNLYNCADVPALSFCMEC